VQRSPIRAPYVDRCAFYMREIGGPRGDDRAQRRRRWRVVGTAH